MWEAFYSPGLLAYLAGGFYVLGLVFINQVVLRLLVLIGTGVYVLYYATAAETPLMEAIYVSLLIGVANVIGLMSLYARHSRLSIPRGFADIYTRFPPLPPGDFRILIKLARRYDVTDEKILTLEGQPGKKLYYVVSGATHVRKGDTEFSLPPDLFLGEIAFLTGQPSSATSWLTAGANVLEWDFADLQRRCARSSRFKMALEAAISIDLAGKVARAVGPNSVRYPLGAPSEPWIRAG
ncbi:MAG: cyclic nucleotide-binding domain-containing protein [Pseudomonadota bacterium]